MNRMGDAIHSERCEDFDIPLTCDQFRLSMNPRMITSLPRSLWQDDRQFGIINHQILQSNQKWNSQDIPPPPTLFHLQSVTKVHIPPSCVGIIPASQNGESRSQLQNPINGSRTGSNFGRRWCFLSGRRSRALSEMTGRDVSYDIVIVDWMSCGRETECDVG